MDYLWKAASAWFLGFFPLAEIYVAVPYAVAIGLDDLSVIVWTVFGNVTPALALVIGRVSWWPGAGSKAPKAPQPPEAIGDASPLQAPYVTSGTD